MLSVFISYARRDGSDEAEQLFKALQAENIHAWRDTRSLNPYEGFDSEIEKAIEAASHVVVCVTPDIRREDSFVRREVAFALEENKPIIPLMFPGGRRPITIINHTYIDFTDWDTGMLALLDRIRKPDDDAEPITPQSRRERELAYLEAIGQRYDHWRELYTDIEAVAHIEVPKVRIKTAAAARYLEMQHGIFDRISNQHDSEDDENAKIIKADTFDDLLQGILKYRRIALIGDPGAGKTTTLERLAYELANAAADSENESLPLFARLGAYSGDDFDHFLEASFGGLKLSDYLPHGAVVLLDGLNEMQRDLMPRVNAWLREHKETVVVVSCRKLDYIDLKLDLHRIDVAPLDIRRIYSFIGNYLEDEERDRLFWALGGRMTRNTWGWLRHNNPSAAFDDFWFGNVEGDVFQWELEKRHLKEVQDKLRESGDLPGMLGVVTNPFLLFITINLFAKLGEPPANRGQLFDQFVTLLMEKRGHPASKTRPPWIEESIQRRGLAAVAHRMQMEHTGTSVDELWAKKVLAETLPDQDIDQLLYLAASAGIIEHGKTVRFIHQLLQEYFAAHEMAQDVQKGVPATKYFPDDRWWENTGWEETAILLAGISGDATAVVRWLTPVHPTLAYRCTLESGAPYDENALKTLYEPPAKARYTPLALAKWGRILAQNGDTRPGVGIRADGLPDIAWCEIPAGHFIYQEGQELTLPTVYISKYPLTYVQFQGFLDAPDGYCNSAWWDGLAYRKPVPGNQHFMHANHPRDRVSWYDAIAYTRWLSSKLGYEVRLPTDQEWEKAARGPDGRQYPWGNEYIPGYANIDETWHKVGPYYLRMTTAVGIYPHNVSPFGVYDLIGNVWEWTLTEFDNGQSNDLSSNARRILRGGAWRTSVEYACILHRHYKYPANRDYHIGLRLASSAPIFSSQPVAPAVTEEAPAKPRKPAAKKPRRKRSAKKSSKS